MKLEPLTVRVKPALPGATDAGETPLMFGMGIGAGPACAMPGENAIKVASRKATAVARPHGSFKRRPLFRSNRRFARKMRGRFLSTTCRCSSKFPKAERPVRDSHISSRLLSRYLFTMVFPPTRSQATAVTCRRALQPRKCVPLLRRAREEGVMCRSLLNSQAAPGGVGRRNAGLYFSCYQDVASALRQFSVSSFPIKFGRVCRCERCGPSSALDRRKIREGPRKP